MLLLQAVRRGAEVELQHGHTRSLVRQRDVDALLVNVYIKAEFEMRL